MVTRFGPLTIYSRDSAMHGAFALACWGGQLVVFPPVRSWGHRQRTRAYWSPNGTPWHHGLVPLLRARRPTACVCGEPDCPIPRLSGEDTPHA